MAVVGLPAQEKALTPAFRAGAAAEPCARVVRGLFFGSATGYGMPSSGTSSLELNLFSLRIVIFPRY